MHRRLIYSVFLVGVLLAPPAATAHITAGKAGNVWYLDAQTYGENDGTNPLDPLNLMFFRSAALASSAANINTAFADHWTGHGHMSSTAKCTLTSGDQWVRFRAYRRYNGADRQSLPLRDFQELNGASVSWKPCADEYHVRWWKDDSHASIATAPDSHGAAGQWVIGDAHHEDRGYTDGHKIDRDWSTVRNHFIKYMAYYCGRRHFKYNAASYGPYQDFPNDGYIGALGLTPRSAGC
jgi:hypothetical protein